MSFVIEKITAEEVTDSRGKPTVLVRVFSGDCVGEFSVPSGASTGEHEAFELRDPNGHVSQAISNVEQKISPLLVGHDLYDQSGIDNLMLKLDGTGNKRKIGANAILGVSVAVAKTAALTLNLPLYAYLRQLIKIADSNTVPYLFINLINGGKHANNGLAFQEYHVVPDTLDPREAVALGQDIQNELTKILQAKNNGLPVPAGDEGGLAPEMHAVSEPLELLKEAVVNLNISHKVKFALDVAASSFYLDGAYEIDGVKHDTKELFQLYESILKSYPVFSIEDPFQEEDFNSFALLREKFPDLYVVGDDLTVTSKDRLALAIQNKSINAIIIKPNQVGTLTETLATMELAVNNKIKLIISHRSGETMDDFIADLAYAFGAFGLKAGSPLARERMVKYERLIKISKK